MCDNYYCKLYHQKKMMLNVVFILLLMHYSRIDDFCRKREWANMHPVLGYFDIARPLKTYKNLFFIYKKSFLPILYALQELSIKPNPDSKLIFVDRARDPGTGLVSERVQLTFSLYIPENDSALWTHKRRFIGNTVMQVENATVTRTWNDLVWPWEKQDANLNINSLLFFIKREMLGINYAI